MPATVVVCCSYANGGSGARKLVELFFSTRFARQNGLGHIHEMTAAVRVRFQTIASSLFVFLKKDDNPPSVGFFVQGQPNAELRAVTDDVKVAMFVVDDRTAVRIEQIFAGSVEVVIRKKKVEVEDRARRSCRQCRNGRQTDVNGENEGRPNHALGRRMYRSPRCGRTRARGGTTSRADAMSRA